MERKRFKWRKTNVKELLCVVPAVLMVIVTTYYPLMDLVRISFTDWDMLKKDYKFVGLTNWEWFIKNAKRSYFFDDMKVTLIYTFFTLVISLVLGMLLALLMGRMSRSFGLMRAVIFMPRYVAMSTAGVIFVWMLNTDYGIINNVLAFLGAQRIPWLTLPVTAMISVLILSAWHSVGYSMMIYLSAMTGIPKDYYENASLDGASRRVQFFKITLPMLSPTTMFLLVTTFISSMKVYNSIDVLTEGGPYRSTEVIVYLIYRLAFVDYRVDRAAVVATVFFLILLVVTVLTMRWSENKVNYDT